MILSEKADYLLELRLVLIDWCQEHKLKVDYPSLCKLTFQAYRETGDRNNWSNRMYDLILDFYSKATDKAIVINDAEWTEELIELLED